MKKFIALLLIGCMGLLSSCSLMEELIGKEAADALEQEIQTMVKESWEQSKEELKEDWTQLNEELKEEVEKDLDKPKEIKTITRVVTIEADTPQEWQEQVDRIERSIKPIINNAVFINANGEYEDRGYMIIGRKVLEYRTMTYEVPISWALTGVDKTKTRQEEVPYKVEYTLHKHELENKLTENALGKFLAGIVGLKIIATQTCDCGYTSTIDWDLPIPDPSEHEYPTGDYKPGEYKVPGGK